MGRPHPLRCCQWTGFIVATGWGSVPVECEDGEWLYLELCLRDAEGDDFRFDFTAAVDQRFKLEYERSRQTRSATDAVTAKRNLFEPVDEADASEMFEDISRPDTKPSGARDSQPKTEDRSTDISREGKDRKSGPASAGASLATNDHIAINKGVE